ncbi:MAG: hypothetical protein Q9220_002480 [cf. Caloplaca sp. 1 TL-2023]
MLSEGSLTAEGLGGQRRNDDRGIPSNANEAQKYEGALYKDKPSKQNKKSVKISTPSSLAPRKAFVEDAPDVDDNAVSVVRPPPEAPTPPPAVSAKNTQPVNVFDFLVNGDSPNASKVSLGGTRSQMEMKPHAPPLFDSNRQASTDSGTDHEYDSAYERAGYTYGSNPVPAKAGLKQLEYQTPAPKTLAASASRESMYELDGAERRSTDKKRKRQHVEELDLTAARLPSRQELDSVMRDAPTPVLHSGLTGGLNRLLSKSTKLPPSPEYSNSSQQPDPSPPSPVVKRKKRSVVTTFDGERVRKTTSGALVRVRKAAPTTAVRRASDESNRPRKQHKLLKQHGEDEKHHRGDDRQRRNTGRAIEYHPNTSSVHEHGSHHQQIVVYRSRAELFLSFVNKGPDSEHGCSLNKALKRYHRERGERGLGLGKQDEEKELWKSLRVRRNERGEVVILGA